MLMSFNARRGRWKEATYWMSEVKARGLKPSHKCYRFLIDSCNKGGKGKLALEYIDEMLSEFADEDSLSDLNEERDDL
jgi:pentatricopeptide repeat protein